MSSKSDLVCVFSARSNVSTTSARSNVSTTGARPAPTMVLTSSSASVNVPTTSHERRLAARAASRAATTSTATPLVTIRRRGNTRFPQPKISPIPEDIQILLGSYCEAVETACLRNLGLRFALGPVGMRKCFPDECGCVHLPRDVRLCNSFLEYLRANVANGIDCLSAAQSCQHDYCKFWPCNLVANKKIIKKKENAIATAAAVAAVAAVAADTAARFEQTAVFADSTLIVHSEKPKSTYTECPEKVLMKVNNPMLHKVWTLPKYRNLSIREFLDSVHANYKSWNTVKSIFINSTGYVGDDDEWDCDIAEVEQKDHREQYADFLAAQLEIPLCQDKRVLGSQSALSIATKRSDIFAEYLNVHWKSGSRSEVLGAVQTFNTWLTVHPSYSSTYQLFKSGMSWRDAKEQLKGIHRYQHVEEKFDWETAEVVPGTTRLEEIDIAKQMSQMDSLLSMTSVDKTEKTQKKEIFRTKETMKEIRDLEAPEFLNEHDSDLFLERDMQGRFAVYIKLEKKCLQSDKETISEIWDKFRVGPGRSSFVKTEHEMFLCISGSIKKVTGFCEMFEKFPGFITALQRKKYVTNESLYVVPVHSTQEFSQPGNKIQLTYVQDSNSKKQNEDIGFDFEPDVSFEDIRKGESGAHALCDILVNYFK